MKKILGFCILLAVLVSCVDKNEYVVKGTVADRDDLEGETLYLYTYHVNGDFEMDSAIIKNNRFQLKGKREEGAILYAYVDIKDVYGDIARGIPVLVKPGKVSIDIKGEDVRIGGNEENDRYQQLVDDQKPLMDRMEALEEEYNASDSEERKSEIQAEYSPLLEDAKEMIVKFMYDNMDNPFGEMVFVQKYDLLTLEQAQELIGKADESFASNPEVVDILAFMTPKNRFPEGTKYFDFTLQDMNGKTVSLSDYVGKGKYILLDFWASWCPPCMQEMPFLVSFYNEIKNEKFEIIGVSLDENKEQWMEAVKKNKMTWPQMADLKKSLPATELYQVTSIPYTVLIGPDGNIIADNLRGEELEEAVLHALNIPHEH